MKAIVLAAGQGSRLWPLTSDLPKCMVELWGKPLLHWQVAALREAGISDILVVTGYQADKVLCPDIRKRYNPSFASVNMVHSLFSVADELTEDILIAYGDLVYHPRIITAMMAAHTPFRIAVDTDWQRLWSLRMEDPLEDAETLKLAADGTVLELGKKAASFEEIQGQYMGIIALSATMLEPMLGWYSAMDRTKLYDCKTFDQMFMTSFLSEVAQHVHALSAVLVEGGWCEVDTVSDITCYEREGKSLVYTMAIP